nr:EAL domain-containing protein [Oscillibacter sp. PC13]
MEQHHFKVYLQPKICLADGCACGAEALVRWQHPERGLICPDKFISLFEKNGNICRLDLYVFEEVCKLLRRRMDSGQLLFPISVNLSRQHFQDPDFLNTYEALARRYGILRGIIELELTEAVFFDDRAIENVKREIRRMHEMGFSCFLDDFGSGFSSLGLLMEFDIDTIKLDRRLTKNLSNQKARCDMVQRYIYSKPLPIPAFEEWIPQQNKLP